MRVVLTRNDGRIIRIDEDSDAVIIEIPHGPRVNVNIRKDGKADITQANNVANIQFITDDSDE